jgi:hypothetical protein
VVTATAAQDLQDVVVTSSIGTGPDWLGSTDVSVDNVLYARRDQQSFVVSVPAKLLSTGTHTVVVQATDSWGNVGTKKLGVIIDRTGPTLAAAVAGPPKTPTVTATTSDPAGISRVEFVRDGVLVATDLTAPYTTTFDTSTWTDGAHSIDVVSVDGFANSTTRTLVITADNTPPVVSLTASGTSPFLLTATAVDASPLAQTVFLVDGATYATDTSAPFAASWGPSDAATHVLTARLRDSFGNEGTATIIAPRDTWAPTTTLSATQSGYAVMLSVLAIDPCGITLPMEVRVDGILVAQPNLQTWSGVLPTGLFSAGQHTLSLVAADRCGNTAQSSQTFSILLNTPIVSIVKDAGVDKKHPIVRATVTHDRPIARVEFWRVGPSGTTVVATDTTAPYSTVLDTSSWPDGTLGVAAVAIDSIGMPGRADTDVLVDNTPPAVAVTWTHNGGHAVQFDLTVGNGLGGSPLVDVWMAVFGLIPTTHFQHPPYRLIATPLGSTTDLVGGGCATDDYGNQGCTSVALRLACQTSGRGLETCTVTLLPW